MKTTVKWPPLLALVAVAAAAVAAWLLLPELVAMQIGMDGNPSNVMPKPFAVAVPLIIGLWGAWELKKEVGGKGILLAALGVLMPIFMIWFNR